MKRIVCLVLSLFCLSGCWGFWHHKGPTEGLSTPQARSNKELMKLVDRAVKHFRSGQWDLAEEAFREIRDRYPDSPYALWAELKMADCKFFAKEYLEAVVLYQEFEKLHPTNEAIPYVIYQIATCYYKRMLSPDRDQTYTKKALENYERLLRNYPDSPYKLVAKRRIQKCRERLAEHEFYVAKFYYRTKRYRAAYARLLYLLQTYPETRTAQRARPLSQRYYHKALEETKALAEGTLKDYWGRPVR